MIPYKAFQSHFKCQINNLVRQHCIMPIYMLALATLLWRHTWLYRPVDIYQTFVGIEKADRSSEFLTPPYHCESDYVSIHDVSLCEYADTHIPIEQIRFPGPQSDLVLAAEWAFGAFGAEPRILSDLRVWATLRPRMAQDRQQRPQERQDRLQRP